MFLRISVSLLHFSQAMEEVECAKPSHPENAQSCHNLRKSFEADCATKNKASRKEEEDNSGGATSFLVMSLLEMRSIFSYLVLC